jgi:hypothetical protein
MKKMKEEKIPNINAVNIDQQMVNGIKSVPTIRSESGEIYVGKAAFNLIEKMTQGIDAYEFGFGSGIYSSISQDDALCENQQQFTFLTPDGFDMDYTGAGSRGMTTGNQNPNANQNEMSDKATKQNDELDKLIEARKRDLPAPHQRV